MILGGQELRRVFEEGTWGAYRDEEQIPMADLLPLIGPNSIDVTLSPHILRLGRNVQRQTYGEPVELPLDVLDPASCNLIPDTIVANRGIVLNPGDFVLGCTNERFVCAEAVPVSFQPTALVAPGPGHLPNLTIPMHFAPMYEGRSTLGRCGIGTHVTAGFGDYGFSGAFTLEIFNVGARPVRLHRDIRVGQIFFMAVHNPKVYDGAYSSLKAPKHNSRPVGPSLGRHRFIVNRRRPAPTPSANAAEVSVSPHADPEPEATE